MRTRIYMPFLALMVICAAWSGLWAFTAHSVGVAIDAWFQDEKSAGRNWDCRERSLGGYPFRIEFRCDAPTFTATVDGVSTTGRLAGLIAVANAYQPNLIVAEGQAPLQIRTGEVQMEMGWSELRISHRLKDGVLMQFAAEVEKPLISYSKSGPVIEIARADRVEVFARPSERAGQLEGAVRVVRAILPLANDLTGEPDPLDLIGRAKFTSAGLLEAAPLRRRLEAWRRAGGSIELSEFKVAKADTRIDATGKFGLDVAHRPQGRLDLQASNLEPILKRLGIPTAAVTLGTALSTLLPGAKQQVPEGDQKERSLKLPLVVENGRISVGPVRTPFQVLPLY